MQPDPRALLAIALDREFPGQQRQHDQAIHGSSRAIDDGDIARKQPCPRHALAGDPDGEGRGRIFDQQFVEIEGAIEVIVGRRGKAARGRGRHQRYRSGPSGLDVEERVDMFSLPSASPAPPKAGLVSRTTFKGSPGGRPIRFVLSAMNPPTFCYRKSDREEARLHHNNTAAPVAESGRRHRFLSALPMLNAGDRVLAGPPGYDLGDPAASGETTAGRPLRAVLEPSELPRVDPYRHGERLEYQRRPKLAGNRRTYFATIPAWRRLPISRRVHAPETQHFRQDNPDAQMRKQGFSKPAAIHRIICKRPGFNLQDRRRRRRLGSPMTNEATFDSLEEAQTQARSYLARQTQAGAFAERRNRGEGTGWHGREARRGDGTGAAWERVVVGAVDRIGEGFVGRSPSALIPLGPTRIRHNAGGR